MSHPHRHPRRPGAEPLGMLLGMAARMARGKFETALESSGLRFRHFQLLASLCHSDKSLSQLELGRRSHIDRTSMVKIVDELEEMGFVQRDRNPEDRRSFLVSITPEGREALFACFRSAHAAEKDLLGPLTPEEGEQLRTLLRKLTGRGL